MRMSKDKSRRQRQVQEEDTEKARKQETQHGAAEKKEFGFFVW